MHPMRTKLRNSNLGVKDFPCILVGLLDSASYCNPPRQVPLIFAVSPGTI